MSDLSYRIEGIDEVIREIARRQLNARKTIRQMLAPGADIVKDAVKQRGKGRFRILITRRITLSMARLEAGAEIGPVKNVTYIARFLEFGTAPHEIVARKAPLLRLRNGRLVKRVNHPGSRPYPFLQPAFDASKDQATAAIAAKIKEVLDL